MADPRKPLEVESKEPESKPIDIDPTNPEHRKLLDVLLLAEEKKHGQKGIFKRKEWQKDEIYPLPDGRAIRLPNHEIHRTPKRYAAVIVLGPDEALPSVEDRRKEKIRLGGGLIYLQKGRDGIIRACTINEPKMKELSEEQKIKLQQEQEINFDSPGKIIDRNKTSHNKIFAIQEICDYPKYIYRINEIKQEPDKKGTYGKVYYSIGKLEFSNGKSDYIDNKSKRLDGDNRPAKKEKITKKISTLNPLSIQLALAELQLLLENPALAKRLHTKFGTKQKNKEGIIESISITQRRAPGESLFDILNNCQLDLGTILSDPERYKLIKMLLKAVCDDHTAGIIHRDIKPENIMIHIVNGEVKEVNIIDYGLAGSLSGYVGTPGFAAPEIAANKMSRSISDDYSLGLVLRAICGDESTIDRHGILFHETVKNAADRTNYAIAQYHLNLSIRAMDLSFRSEYTELMKNILTGMTKTSPTERLSSKDALIMMDAYELGETAELKNPDEKPITENDFEALDKNFVAAINRITAIQNAGIKDLLFREACDALETFRSSLDSSLQYIDKDSEDYTRARESLDFITQCQSQISASFKSKTHEVAKDKYPIVIYHISKILLEEKILLKNNTFLEYYKEGRREGYIDDLSHYLQGKAKDPVEAKENVETDRYHPPSLSVTSSTSSMFSPTSSSANDATTVKIHFDDPKKSKKSP